MCRTNCFHRLNQECLECAVKENEPSGLPSIELLAKLVGKSGSAAKKWATDKAVVPVKKRQRAKKSVRFCHLYNKVNFRLASSEDLKRSWNQPEDYRKFKVEARNSVMQANAKDGGECIRGLEFMVSEDVRSMRRQWIEETIKGVLVKQGIQKLLGLPDPDQLSETAAAASKNSQICAVVLAAIDQKERDS